MLDISFIDRFNLFNVTNYNREVISYNHTITNNIGYDTASINIAINPTNILNTAYDLIGKNIEVHYSDSELIWTGFVNQVDINLGNSAVSFGPYTEIANKVLVYYTEYTTGVPGVTTYTNDTKSQNFYGVVTKILSSGNVSATNADKIRDVYLYENAYPKVSKTVSSAISENTMTVSCLGNYHLLGLYPYNNLSSGSITLSDKIKLILEAQPNTFFSTNYLNIESNSLSVLKLENSNRLASDIIKELVNLGNASNNNRTVFSIFGNIAEYRTIVYDTRYYLDISSPRPQVTEINANIVSPYKIMPGYFIETVYLTSGRKDTNIQFSPQISLIEAVTYTYPNEFQIRSGNTGTLSQQLAKLGLGGI